MKDRNHTEHIERWAKFVKNTSSFHLDTGGWHFIDAQIIMANKFYERLAKVEGGMEKIRKLRNVER